jgi:hypothetical protein
MTTPNPCGECSMCCQHLLIEALEKPAGVLCSHFKGGCTIYEGRPNSCRGFHCGWLKSQRLAPAWRMGPEWRPDRAKFIMFIKRMSLRVVEGYELLVYVGDRLTVVFPNEDVDLGPVKPEDKIVFGYTERDGQQVPCATVLSDLPEKSQR